MEVPTTAAYVICVSVAGLRLLSWRLSRFQAHSLCLLVRTLVTIPRPQSAGGVHCG